ncbi:hypothetical protein D9M68_467480 [compost metagenome]
MTIFRALKHQRWALLWTLLILVLCNITLPEDNAVEKSFFFKGFDKLAHVGLFFVLTVLLFYGKVNYQHSFHFRTLTIFKILMISVVLGGGIELLQWKIFTSRSAEWWDFGCDLIGSLMGIFSYILLHKSNYNEQKV